MSRMEEYQEYLRSDIWKWKKEAAIEQFGEICQRCGRGHKIHIHHKKYPKVLGQESIFDLEVLCIECHTKQHEKEVREHPERYGEMIDYLMPDNPIVQQLVDLFQVNKRKSNIDQNEKYRCQKCCKIHSPNFLC